MDVTTTQGQGGDRTPFLERLGERINPLVVKEVRQGMRSRVFWACFWMMLLACFLISLAAWTSSFGYEGLRPQGREFFCAFFVCLGVVHFFIIPYSAYRSMAGEREDETWVLLLLTGLGPRRILRGKVGSFLVQAALYASAAGPFLMLSYYLNGIDLPILLTVLALGGCWLVFLTVLAVCAASLAEGKAGRALVHFALLGVLAVGLIYALVSAYALVEEGFRLFVRERALAVFACVFLWMMLTGGWVLFETAAARLSLITENYSRAPRLALVVQTVCSALLLGGAWLYWGSSTGLDVALRLGGLYLTGCGLVLATDVDGQARALRAGTRAWTLLRPGALRGFRLAVLLLLFWTAVCAVLGSLSDDSSGGAFDQTHPALGAIAIAAYALLYLSLPLWVGRLTRVEVFASPLGVRLLFVLGLILGSLLPLLARVLADEMDLFLLINLLNPTVGLDAFLNGAYASTGDEFPWALLACVALVAALSVFLADRALVAREREVHAA